MRIIQLSDIHIDLPEENPYDIDVRKNFTDCLAKTKELNPDWLVVTGDLCNRGGDIESYNWIKTCLDNTEIPYEVIPGNHDDSRILMSVFYPDMGGNELYFSRKWGDHKVLFLDTRPAQMSEVQWKWLDGKLESEDVKIIFMHHPPKLMDVGYMDANHALKEDQRNRFKGLMQKYNRPFYIFCGHYHCDKVLANGATTISISPATFFHLRSDPVEFQLDHKVPGFKVIDLNGDRVTMKSEYLV